VLCPLEAELVGELVAEGTVLGSQAGDLGWSGPRGGLPQRATLILQPTAGGRTPVGPFTPYRALRDPRGAAST